MTNEAKSTEAGTTARWHVINGKPVPDDKGAKDLVLRLLGDHLGFGSQDDEAEVEEKVEDTAAIVPMFEEFWAHGAAHSRLPLDPKGIIFHHSSGGFEGGIDWLTGGNVKASYHVMIDEDGRRVRFVDDRKRAYHAGYGRIHGRNPNHVCLGIAFTGDTQTGKWRRKRQLNPKEIASAMEFITARWAPMGLSLKWCTDHRTVDPTRRNDLAPDQLEVMMRELRKL